MAENNVVYDVNGYDVITKAINSLINQFPMLESSEEINFSLIGEEQGIAFFPVSGAIVQSEVKDVTGHVEQTCSYPFIVFYKVGGLSESGKIEAKEWLETLGMWLERQEITVSGITYQLTDYPPLNNNNRKFEDIQRTSPSYLYDENEDLVDRWAINITATYTNEYDIVN